VTLGLGGVVMIAGATALVGLGREMAGQSAIILATLSSAASAIHGRRFAAVAPEIAAAGTLTSAAVVLVPLSFFVETPLNSAPSAASLAALLANAVVATALGFVVYFHLIRTIGSMGTASVGYLKPAVGVLIGCALMGESLTWTAAGGLIAILIGVAAINQNDSLGALWRPGRLLPIHNGRSTPRRP
jgi:drug/metabolite transporter (DMT)-like permease